MRSPTVLFTALAIAGTSTLLASHNFGGEFRYTHLSALTYEIEVRLYFNVFDPPDQPLIVIYTGDGGADTIAQAGSETLMSDCGDVMRYYVTQHTYPGPGLYSLSLRSPNRRAGIVNVPNSVDIPLCVNAELIVGGFPDSSPRFNNHLSYSYYSGSTFTHELQATDPDGDSLTYALVPPLGDGCGPIPGYQFPDDVLPGQDTSMVDGEGVFTWTSPQLGGFYTIAIQCSEWRDGQLIGHVTRDMTFCVSAPFTGIEPGRELSALTILQSSLAGPITMLSEGLRQMRIDVFDMRGAIVRSLRPSQDRVTLDVDAFADGVYSVRAVDADGRSVTGRFVVAH